MHMENGGNGDGSTARQHDGGAELPASGSAPADNRPLSGGSNAGASGLDNVQHQDGSISVASVLLVPTMSAFAGVPEPQEPLSALAGVCFDDQSRLTAALARTPQQLNSGFGSPCGVSLKLVTYAVMAACTANVLRAACLLATDPAASVASLGAQLLRQLDVELAVAAIPAPSPSAYFLAALFLAARADALPLAGLPNSVYTSEWTPISWLVKVTKRLQASLEGFLGPDCGFLAGAAVPPAPANSAALQTAASAPLSAPAGSIAAGGFGSAGNLQRAVSRKLTELSGWRAGSAGRSATGSSEVGSPAPGSPPTHAAAPQHTALILRSVRHIPGLCPAAGSRLPLLRETIHRMPPSWLQCPAWHEAAGRVADLRPWLWADMPWCTSCSCMGTRAGQQCRWGCRTSCKSRRRTCSGP